MHADDGSSAYGLRIMRLIRSGARGRDRWWVRLHPLAAAIDRRIPVQWVSKRTIISHAHRYCYFRIPKCANSTVVQTLARYDSSLGRTPEGLARRELKRSSRNLFRVWAWSPRSLARRYFCFTIVRNPYTRVLSAYLDKIADGVGEYREVITAVGKDDVHDVTFKEFVEFLEGGGLYMNAHWAPQCALLPIEPESLAFVGHVETLDDDLRTLVARLLPDSGFDGVLSREDRRRDSGVRLAEYFTSDLAARIARLYADDFRVFGYPEALPDTDRGR